MFTRKSLEDKYSILRRALLSCTSMEEINKFSLNLVTLDEFKEYLLSILDNKFKLKESCKLDSIYLNCGSIHDILSDDLHIKILSFISPSQYSSLPCISKHFEFIMSSYPIIYNIYKYQVVISKTLTSTILNGEFSNGIYLSHSLTELKIQPSFNAHFNFEDLKDIGLGITKANIINPFTLKFPWKYIKIWHINNCDLRRRNESKICPPQSIIHVIKKKMLDFNNNNINSSQNGNNPQRKLIKFNDKSIFGTFDDDDDDNKNNTISNLDNLDCVELKIAIASRTVPTCKLLKKACKNIESFNIDCIDNGDDLKLYPSFRKCTHLFIEGSISHKILIIYFMI